MGRTGRKREGKIYVLVTEGREDAQYGRTIHSKNSVNKAILEQSKLNSALCESPRMVPKGLYPTCLKMCMEKRVFVKETKTRKKSHKQQKSPKKQPIPVEEVQIVPVEQVPSVEEVLPPVNDNVTAILEEEDEVQFPVWFLQFHEESKSFQRRVPRRRRRRSSPS